MPAGPLLPLSSTRRLIGSRHYTCAGANTTAAYLVGHIRLANKCSSTSHRHYATSMTGADDAKSKAAHHHGSSSSGRAASGTTGTGSRQGLLDLLQEMMPPRHRTCSTGMSGSATVVSSHHRHPASHSNSNSGGSAGDVPGEDELSGGASPFPNQRTFSFEGTGSATPTHQEGEMAYPTSTSCSRRSSGTSDKQEEEGIEEDTTTGTLLMNAAHPRPVLRSFPFLLPPTWASEVPKRLIAIFGYTRGTLDGGDSTVGADMDGPMMSAGVAATIGSSTAPIGPLQHPFLYTQAFIHPSFTRAGAAGSQTCYSMAGLEPVGQRIVEWVLHRHAFADLEPSLLRHQQSKSGGGNARDITDNEDNNKIASDYTHAVLGYRRAKDALMSRDVLSAIGRSIWTISDMILTDAGLSTLQSLQNIERTMKLKGAPFLGAQQGGEISKGGEALPHGAVSSCVLAVVGAVYLDGGLDVAEAFVVEHILSPAVHLIE